MKKIFVIWAVLIAASSVFAEENTNAGNVAKTKSKHKKIRILGLL